MMISHYFGSASLLNYRGERNEIKMRKEEVKLSLFMI